MGVSIRLDVNFNKISDELWSKVFNEAVKLVEKTPLGYIEEIKHGGYPVYIYKKSNVMDHGAKNLEGNVNSKEKFKQYKILRMSVDLDRKTHGEQFNLLSKKEAYDYDYNNCEYMTNIWNSKTQRFSYHKYILAVGMLIENMLGDAAYVYGDITEEEIEQAKCIIKDLLGIEVNSPKKEINFQSVDMLNQLMLMFGATMGDKIVDNEECLNLVTHLCKHLFQDGHAPSIEDISNESIKKLILEKAYEFRFCWNECILNKIFNEHDRNILVLYGSIVSLENENRDVYQYSSRFFKDIKLYESIVEVLSKFKIS